MTTVALDSLADARPGSYWHDLHALAPVTTPLRHPTTADLVVVGAGFTGLWTAVTAKLRSPDRDVVLLDAEHVGFGATGRNGGFISDSVTHGLAHGLARWPDQIATLLEVGRDNLSGLVGDLHAAGIAPDLSLVGKTIVATTSHQAASLPALADLLAGHGEDAELLDADGVRADVDSPTYLGGIRVRTGGGVMDPVALAVGLRDWALRLGVRMHEQTPVVRVEGTHVVTPLALVQGTPGRGRHQRVPQPGAAAAQVRRAGLRPRPGHRAAVGGAVGGAGLAGPAGPDRRGQPVPLLPAARGRADPVGWLRRHLLLRLAHAT